MWEVDIPCPLAPGVWMTEAGGVCCAHFAIAEKRFTMPVSFGFSKPLFNLFFMTATNSCNVVNDASITYVCLSHTCF